jgi:serine/threonine-protein kinase HipA
MNIELIKVRAWGSLVGAVVLDPQRNYYAFQYDPTWAQKGIELAPRMMPVRDPQAFLFTNLAEETYHRLPGMLADAMPDHFGNALINAYMAQRGIGPESITALDRLAYMGKRGMGALEFQPVLGNRKDKDETLEMQGLVEAARQAVQGEISTDKHAKSALADLIRVGTSAGGARAKAVIAWNPGTQEIRSGQFEVGSGFEHWLLKFDGIEDEALGSSKGYGRIEYAFHLMARAVGIEMSDCRLLEENGRAHFMTRRFDRDGNFKHHTQTLCAMEHLDFKQARVHAYEQAFACTHRLGMGPDAVDQLFLRMAFNVMARNCDDHTKNLSFILKEGGEWNMAPAYDVAFAYKSGSPWVSQHQMSVNQKFDGITREDLQNVADRFGVRRPNTLLGNVLAAVKTFDEFATKAKVSKETMETIPKQFVLLNPPVSPTPG